LKIRHFEQLISRPPTPLPLSRRERSTLVRERRVRDLIQRALRARFRISVLWVAGFFLWTCEISDVPSSEASHETARRMRREQTPAEQVLWRHLRGRRMCNAKFRRQFPIGSYFVDFCSIERRLIIEVDGDQHAERFNEDEKRTSFLNSLEYRVLRFWNDQVLKNTDEVLAEIEKFLRPDSSES
jgi:very-short-patch-repair endonuclease